MSAAKAYLLCLDGAEHVVHGAGRLLLWRGRVFERDKDDCFMFWAKTGEVAVIYREVQVERAR